MRLLVISYYWPPSTNVGSRRWYTFCHELVKKGWQIHILTNFYGHNNNNDESLKIHYVPLKGLLSSFFSKKMRIMHQDPVSPFDKKGLQARLFRWIRIHCVIPDPYYYIWYKNAVIAGNQILKSYHFDRIVSTSPPATVALVARTLSNQNHIPWIVDFRDPWTGIHHYEGTKRNWVATYIDKRLEKLCWKDSSSIFLAQRKFFPDLEKKYLQKWTFIINCLKTIDPPIVNRSSLFTLRYVGRLTRNQITDAWFDAIKQWEQFLKTNNMKAQIEWIGTIDPYIKKKMVFSYVRNIWIGQVSFEEANQYIKAADLLLLFGGKWRKSPPPILPYKLLEYMACYRPILGILEKDSTAAKFIRETEIGRVVSLYNYQDIYLGLCYYTQMWAKNGGMLSNCLSTKTTKYRLDRVIQKVDNHLRQPMDIP